MGLILNDLKNACELEHVCDYVNNRTTSSMNYISTENMLPNKGGISESTIIPPGTTTEYKIGDILISNIRPYFQKIWCADRCGGCSADVLCIRAKENTDSKYLYYLLSQQAFFDYVMSGAKGCKMPRGDKKQIMQWPVNIPAIDVQKKVVAILSSLDNKIRLNRRINDNLEEQAKALFKSWFVDNNGEKWRKGIVSDFYDISIGKTPPRKESQWFTDSENGIVWASISDMGSCNVFLGNSSEYLTKEAVRKFKVCVVPENTILLSFKLTIGRVAIADKEMATNEAIAHFIAPNNAIEYTYLALKNYEFSSLGSTSSIATAINSKIIKSMPWMMPDEDTLNLFHQIVLPVFERMRNNCQEIICLSSLRDTLLPKLMSGELSVEEVSFD